MRMTLVIWVISIVFAIPAMLFSDCEEMYIQETNQTLSICSTFPSEEHGRFMVTFQFLTYYLLPIVGIGFLYFLMARQLSLSSRCPYKEQVQDQPTHILAKKQFASIVSAFLIIFVVCSFPIQIFTLWYLYNPNLTEDFTNFWHFLSIIGFYLFIINFCLKSVVLYFTSKSYQKYFNYYLVRCSHKTLDEFILIPDTNFSRAAPL
ncbi:hypothetical protein J6590_026297 [Homalodisca vitripennis]|nr:hypothetical protein J6590_026297 [Homalodisca vitripennis]